MFSNFYKSASSAPKRLRLTQQQYCTAVQYSSTVLLYCLTHLQNSTADRTYTAGWKFRNLSSKIYNQPCLFRPSRLTVLNDSLYFILSWNHVGTFASLFDSSHKRGLHSCSPESGSRSNKTSSKHSAGNKFTESKSEEEQLGKTSQKKWLRFLPTTGGKIQTRRGRPRW